MICAVVCISMLFTPADPSQTRYPLRIRRGPAVGVIVDRDLLDVTGGHIRRMGSVRRGIIRNLGWRLLRFDRAGDARDGKYDLLRRASDSGRRCRRWLDGSGPGIGNLGGFQRPIVRSRCRRCRMRRRRPPRARLGDVLANTEYLRQRPGRSHALLVGLGHRARGWRRGQHCDAPRVLELGCQSGRWLSRSVGGRRHADATLKFSQRGCGSRRIVRDPGPGRQHTDNGDNQRSRTSRSARIAAFPVPDQATRPAEEFCSTPLRSCSTAEQIAMKEIEISMPLTDPPNGWGRLTAC